MRPHLLVAIAMLWIGFDAEKDELEYFKNLFGFDSSQGKFEGSIFIGVLGIAKTVIFITFGLFRKKLGNLPGPAPEPLQDPLLPDERGDDRRSTWHGTVVS